MSDLLYYFDLENTDTTLTAEVPGDDRPPLWKQLLGAALGGGLALALYYGYEAAKPVVTAYITLPPVEGGRMYDLGAANIANDSLTENERKRIVSRNMRAAAAIEGKDVDVEAIESNTLDISWPDDEVVEEEPAAVEADAVTDEEADAEIADIGEDEEEADDWESLWSDMKKEEEEESERKETIHSEAPALPDSGFGALIAIAGSAAGAATMRLKKKKA